MPPHKELASLKELSKEKVLYNICAVILDEIFKSKDEGWEAFGAPILSPRLQSVRDILADGLGSQGMQEMLNTILEKDEAIEVSVRYLALQILLVQGIQSLSVGHFPEFYYTIVLEAIAESAASLEKLDLKGLWVREEDKLSLCKALRRLHNIKNLTIRYVCDDDVLSIVGKHCPKLERLDISGSANISETGLMQLLCNTARYVPEEISDVCQSLRIVDIGGPGAQSLPPEFVSKLLINIQNLVSVGCFEKTGQALEIIHKAEPSRKFRLRYIHDQCTNSKRMSVIVKTCPDLQAVYFDSPGAVAVQHLDMLKNLSEIKLNKIKCEDLLALLHKCGVRLRSIFLLSVWGQLDLIILGSLCPNLKRVELHSVSLICSDTSHPTAFKGVKEMLIYSTQITTNCVKFIMNQSTSMEHLALGQCGDLSDAAIICSLMDYSLKNLHTLWLGQAEELTMRTLNALLEHCPLLTNLGNVNNWNIHPDDLAILRVQLILTNTDLTIYDIGPENDEADLIIIMP